MSIHDETWDKCIHCKQTIKTWHGDYHTSGGCLDGVDFHSWEMREGIDNIMEDKKYTYEETAQYLHYHADRLDKEIIKDLVDKNLSSAYNNSRFSESLRIAANFIGGVQGK